jgi:hypothetical protein
LRIFLYLRGIKLLSIEPVDEKADDLFVFFVDVILLGLALDKIAVESSFENRRIMACELFVNNNRLRICLATSIKSD